MAVTGYALSRLVPPDGRTPAGPVRAGVPLPAPEAAVARHFREAVFLLHARDYGPALTTLHRVLALAPRLPEAHVNAGFALPGLERYAAARDFFQHAIALRPGQANAYRGLAASLEALCDLAGATGAMRSYVHLTDTDDPFLPKARAALWEWEAQTARGADAGCTPGDA